MHYAPARLDACGDGQRRKSCRRAGQPLVPNRRLPAIPAPDDRPDSHSQFWFVIVEPGVDAGRVSVDLGEGMMSDYLMTTYRVTALRVWREKVANYVGVEGA